MVKNGEETAKKEGKTTGNVLPVLLGTGTGLVLLLLLTLLAAGLIWSGVLPVSIAGMSLTIAAGLCALVGGRVAVNRGSGGSLPMGSAAGGLLCLILGLVCLGTTGTEGFHGQFVGILLMTLAGGCLAGLMGKKKRKKKWQSEAVSWAMKVRSLCRISLRISVRRSEQKKSAKLRYRTTNKAAP